MSCDPPLWKNASRIGRHLRNIGIGLVLAAGLTGCFAHARGELVYDQPVEYVDTVPERIEYYPSTYYQGQPAYLVEGRWYYPHNRRWVVFREEPVELRQYRTQHARAYSDSPRYATHSKSLAPRRADSRRFEERRASAHRAEARRRDEQRAERRAEQRRSEEHRAREHRARERHAEARRDESHRAAQRRAEVRRMEDRGGAERRVYTERRVAERKARPQRKGDRDRRDRADDRNDRDRRRYRD